MSYTVLVSGSAGFIGGYVVEELLGSGHTVIGIDNNRCIFVFNVNVLSPTLIQTCM